MNLSMQKIAFDWAKRCFGEEHVMNSSVRSLRIAEEAVELCQSFKVPQETLHKLIDIVYSRPVNSDWTKEMGGVILTLCVLAERHGVDLDLIFEHELRRILSIDPSSFAHRNQAKIDMGL